MTEVSTGVLGPYWFASTEVVPWLISAEFTLIGHWAKTERLMSLGLLNSFVPGEDLMSEAQP
jgi:hypothetical protein